MTRSNVCACAFAGVVLSLANAHGQHVSMVADINQQAAPFGFYPHVVGGDGTVTIFEAADEEHGREPWITDGTPGGTRLIADMQPGGGSSYSVFLGRLGSTIVFANGPSPSAMSIWAIDSTASDPVLISPARAAQIRLRPGGIRQVPQSAALGDSIIFAAQTPDSGMELWTTQGTPESTHLLADLTSDDDDSSPSDFFVADGVAYFAARDRGTQLWRTDGTANGTFIVYDSPKLQGLSPSEFFDAGDFIFFFASGPERTGRELWRTDGTTEGTVLVHEIAPGPANSSASNLAGTNAQLFFYATANGNAGLYALDIETADLTFLAPYSGTPYNPPLPPAIIPAGALFIRSTPEFGDELWRTDGTPEGTELVRDLNPGAATGALDGPVAVGSLVVFRADDGMTGPSLWSSDGTPEGTRRLVSALDSVGLSPDAVAGGRLLVTLNDGVQGFTLWGTDGTSAGTGPLIAPPPAGTDAGSSPGRFSFIESASGNVVFSANDGIHGFEPWILEPDGQVRLIRDVRPGQLSGPSGAFVSSADQAFFVAYLSETGSELWRTDGTEDGTRLVRDIEPGPLSSISSRLAPVPGGVVFGAFTDTGNDVWASDGTEANTRIIQNLTPDFVTFEMHTVGDRAYFAPFGGLTANSLRVTNGTSVQTAATVTGAWIMANTYNVARIGTTLVFVALDMNGAAGYELWAKPSGGSSYSLGEIEPGPASPDVSHFVQSDSLAFFSAFTSDGGYELWRTDATPGGTLPALDIVPGAGSSSPEQLTVAGDVLFFTARTPEHGRELWVSDGTPAGTLLVADINPGPGSSTPLGLTRTGPGRVIFSAHSPGRGAELWESDGTPQGTRLVADIIPGPRSSGPADFFVRDAVVLFSATDGVHGRELWQYDPNACACDWNASGTLDSGDFFDFLLDFFAGDADFNSSGSTDSSDFFDFVACFFVGCP